MCEKDADPSFLFLNLEGLANSNHSKENKKKKGIRRHNLPLYHKERNSALKSTGDLFNSQ
jgi:hypothetical protein